MASFTIRLVERIRGAGISDISVYAESFPAPKALTPNIVAVLSSGELLVSQGRKPWFETKRILVAGSTSGAMAKAQALLSFFIPDGRDPKTGFIQNEYACYTVLLEARPHLLSNVGNVFIVEFQLKFMISD